MSFERILMPWLGERVLEDGAELIALDKPPGIPVHGGDEALREDVVCRAAAWLRANGRDDYLGVHQRLDKPASGVLVLARSRDLNAALAREFAEHTLRRTYLAGVSGPLASGGQLEHQLAAVKGERTRVVERGGKLARTSFRVLERASGRCLVELVPETGRTHQLRAQLAAVGAPIAGDTLYGGVKAWRLMLHARSLELPAVGKRFESPVPWDLTAWLRREDGGLGPADRLARALLDAAWLRAPLAPRTNAYRLVNEHADGLPGVAVDRFVDYALLAISSAEAEARTDELARGLMELGARGVLLRRRPRADLRRADPAELAPSEPLAGARPTEKLVVEEHGMRFAVRLGAGLSSGLFLDQRDNRQLVKSIARGARVLNLFSYTCSFSVAAALGGAHVTSVDVSGRALDQGRENFELNALNATDHRFVRADVLDWVERAARRGERFEIVVLDPPSFATRGGAFTMAKGYPALARAVCRMLERGGRLLAVTNHRGTSRAQLRRAVRRAAEDAACRVQQLKDLASGFDCPEGPEGPLPSKSLLLTIA